MVLLPANKPLIGAFSGTGSSDSIQVDNEATLSLDFGSGTVILKRKNLSGTFVPTGDSWTADVVQQIDVPGEYALECTNYSTAIGYEIANTL